MIFLEDLNSVDENLTNLSDNELTKIFLYCSTQYSFAVNCHLLNSSVKGTENSKHFSGPFHPYNLYYNRL